MFKSFSQDKVEYQFILIMLIFRKISEIRNPIELGWDHILRSTEILKKNLIVPEKS